MEIFLGSANVNGIDGISNENGVGICEHKKVNVLVKELVCLSVSPNNILKHAGQLSLT